MNVMGLDLSLTSTGVALTRGDTWRVRTNAADRLEIRLAAIVDGVHEAIDACGADDETVELVAIEDMVTQAKFAGATAPVHGAVRLWLWKFPLPVVLIAPKSLKLYASGNGNCDKQAMADAALKRAGVDFGKKHDECDAWWLRAMTLDAYGEPVVDVPASQRAAMEKVHWPQMAEAAS